MTQQNLFPLDPFDATLSVLTTADLLAIQDLIAFTFQWKRDGMSVGAVQKQALVVIAAKIDRIIAERTRLGDNVPVVRVEGSYRKPAGSEGGGGIGGVAKDNKGKASGGGSK